MKKLFYVGLAGWALFEVSNVYFIMPMPGSQRINSIDLAYFLYSYRWVFRIVFGAFSIAGVSAAFSQKIKWVPALALIATISIIYLFNFVMSADYMFLQPKHIVFKDQKTNILSDNALVVCVDYEGQVKAFPVRYILYHHQVQDTIGGKPVIITYCNVCRTGRVYEPIVKGQYEKFRLVGMDHFNAMFEDAATRSWWRQVNGEAIVGSLKGEMLPEIESQQMTVKKLFELYPHALVMQEDAASKLKYDTLGKFERGKSKSSLTRTDSLSWQDKSWVIGIKVNEQSKAYDWNQLKKVRIINDKIGHQPIVLALAQDGQSFSAFVRPDTTSFILRGDTLVSANEKYSFAGIAYKDTAQKLKRIKAYQEFWYSWRTFHPSTARYK
ncbi:MAG: DUF3179 domain-containing protein [Bacteroidetes bacterium]|nr:DUF3179 domain-containing protein [Bacteroidota bacterium]